MAYFTAAKILSLLGISSISGVNTGDQTLPVKNTGAEINTGTDDAKFATAKSITDSNVAFLSDITGTNSGTNTGDNATNTQYSGLAASKQDALVSGTNIKTINSSSILGSGNLSVSASITETEIDVGSTPVAEASIAVTDAGVTATSKILGGVAYKAPTGKDLDELEMDALEIKFEPGTGTFNVKIKGLEGYIADKFIIWYTVAA